MRIKSRKIFSLKMVVHSTPGEEKKKKKRKIKSLPVVKNLKPDRKHRPMQGLHLLQGK